MVNNGTLHYDHDRDGTHTQIAGCEANFRNSDKDTHVAIRYENDVLAGKFRQHRLVFHIGLFLQNFLCSFNGFRW